MKKLLISTAACAFVLMCGAVYAGSTPWFDIDNPGGVGDYETTGGIFLPLKCRIKGTGQVITTGNPKGYHCELPTGGWCKNAETVPAGRCKDIEVMFSWPAGTPTHAGAVSYSAGSTKWIDRDDPSGVGDYETTADIFKVKCRFVGGDQSQLVILWVITV